MERAAWLERMRDISERLYDRFAPDYWVRYGFYGGEKHVVYLKKFLEMVGELGQILSAACGAGRFDGLLLEAGHSVLGIDQSAGMLARAREHFPVEQYPQLRYEKVGLQEMEQIPAYREAFDGAICMDAMEHIGPEDWPGIMRGFQSVLKPGAPLYFTADARDEDEVRASYERALAMGLPVVYGEIADEVEEAARRALETGEAVDQCVYHFIPPLEQVRAWLEQAGLKIVETGADDEYHHIIAIKESSEPA